MSGSLSRRTALQLGGLSVAAATIPSARGPGSSALGRRCRFGAWSASRSGVLAGHAGLERLVEAQLPVVSWFKDWGRGWDSVCSGVSNLRGAQPYDNMIAWEAWGVPFRDITGGARDDFLVDFFDDARAARSTVTLRLFHEMNGNWYPWSTASTDRLVESTERWVAAWRHVVSVARARGANNVRFMFCPNMNDVGGVPVEAYWPGAEWVDVVGLDGYNWGWRPDGTPQTSAEDVIAPMYDRVTALHPEAAVMVGEIASAAHPDKAQWYSDLFRSTRFPALTQVAFFHERKERNWRLDSDPATLATVRTNLSLAGFARGAGPP